MKKTSSEFANYAKSQTKMSSSSKRKMRKELVGFYGSLYGTAEVANSMQSFFTPLFQGKMTFAKLAVYLITGLTVSTGVYASVAPQSFAKISASVKAGVVAVVDTTLEVVGIKAKNDTKAELTVEAQAGSDSDTNAKKKGKGIFHFMLGGDSDTQANGQAEGTARSDTSIKTDTNIQVVKAGVDADTVIDEVDIVVDGALDAAGDVDANINALIKSDTSTTTKTNNAEANTDTSIQGQVEGTINTQGVKNTVKEEKNVVVDTTKDLDPSLEVSSNTSSTTSAQGIVDNGSIEGTVNSATESDNAMGLGL